MEIFKCERFDNAWTRKRPQAQTIGQEQTSSVTRHQISFSIWQPFSILCCQEATHYLKISTNTTVVRFTDTYLYASPVEAVFHHFALPTSRPSLYLASPAETLPCTPPSTPVQFHFISMAVWSGLHAGPKSISSHRGHCLYWGIQHSASHSAIGKEKANTVQHTRQKRTHNTKFTYLSRDARALSVRMQVKAMWAGVYSEQLILYSIEDSVVSGNSWRLCSNGCAHAVER